MSDLRKLLILQFSALFLFILFKSTRAQIISGNPPAWIRITLFSLPNFFEAVMGIILLTMIGLYINQNLKKKNHGLGNRIIYFSASIIASLYVITQELKIHNLGGENIYDPYDILFSVIGLGVGLALMLRLSPSFHSDG